MDLRKPFNPEREAMMEEAIFERKQMELRKLQQEEVFGRNDLQQPSSVHDYGQLKQEIL